MATLFRFVFTPGETHTRTRVYSSEDGGTEVFAGEISLPRDQWPQLMGSIEMGSAFVESKPRIEIEASPAPPAAMRGVGEGG